MELLLGALPRTTPVLPNITATATYAAYNTGASSYSGMALGSVISVVAALTTALNSYKAACCTP